MKHIAYRSMLIIILLQITSLTIFGASLDTHVPAMDVKHITVQVDDHHNRQPPPELYRSINPAYRDWSLVHGITAYQSNMLSNFFKNHEHIESLACRSDIPIHVALKQEDQSYFYATHFDLFKHLFYLQPPQQLLALAQSTKSFSYQVAQNKMSIHNFSNIMAQLISYAISYEQMIGQKPDLANDIMTVEALFDHMQQHNKHELRILEEYKLQQERLDLIKSTALDTIKKEFSEKIKECNTKIDDVSQQKRAHIIDEKKIKECAIAQDITMQKKACASNPDVQHALGVVTDVRKKLRELLYAHSEPDITTVSGTSQKLPLTKTDQTCGPIKHLYQIDATPQAHDQQTTYYIRPDEERKYVIDKLKLAIRADLQTKRDEIIAQFDKKPSEFVRNFINLLESVLIQEIGCVKGLAATMITAFISQRYADRHDKHNLYVQLYEMIEKNNIVFIVDKKLLSPDYDARTTDATHTTPETSLSCIETQPIPASPDRALIETINALISSDRDTIDNYYQQLAYQLFAYDAWSQIAHPHVTYKKNNFMIEVKKDQITQRMPVWFSDCVETTLRNIISELISDGTMFDHAALDALGICDEVKNYFICHSPTYQASQTIEARNEWANLLAAHDRVIYKQTEYACEVKATVKNFLYTLIHLFKPGLAIQKPIQQVTVGDIASIFQHMCDAMNAYFQKNKAEKSALQETIATVKKISIEQVTVTNGSDHLLSHDVLIFPQEHENIDLRIDFLLSKNNITQKVGVIVMNGHAHFDVYKVTNTAPSADQIAITQLSHFLYTAHPLCQADDILQSDMTHHATIDESYSISPCATTNKLIDLLTLLQLNSATKRVQESIEYNDVTHTVCNDEEQLLDHASYLLYLIADQHNVLKVKKYCATLV